jgi:hypothetical protein
MKKTLILFLAFGLIIASCGPSKKLMVSESNVDKLQKDQANTLLQLNDCNAQVKSLKADKLALQNENDSVRNNFKDLSDE